MLENLSITYEDPALKNWASCFSDFLNLPINQLASQQLCLHEGKLALKVEPFTPFSPDFSLSTWKKRREAGKAQGLVRACQPRPGLSILDGTAGWGRDAAILASFGAKVCMVERHPLLYQLLCNALLQRDEESRASLDLSLEHMDLKKYLSNLNKENAPDLIYLDPMHPPRKKKAQVKKALYLLQQLLGPAGTEESLSLLHLALEKAKKKVIVKWPRYAKPLIKAEASILEKTLRFDIYSISA